MTRPLTPADLESARSRVAWAGWEVSRWDADGVWCYRGHDGSTLVLATSRVAIAAVSVDASMPATWGPRAFFPRDPSRRGLSMTCPTCKASVDGYRVAGVSKSVPWWLTPRAHLPGNPAGNLARHAALCPAGRVPAPKVTAKTRKGAFPSPVLDASPLPPGVFTLLADLGKSRTVEVAREDLETSCRQVRAVGAESVMVRVTRRRLVLSGRNPDHEGRHSALVWSPLVAKRSPRPWTRVPVALGLLSDAVKGCAKGSAVPVEVGRLDGTVDVLTISDGSGYVAMIAAQVDDVRKRNLDRASETAAA